MTHDVYVYDAIRTPRGRGKSTGALHSIVPVELVRQLLVALGERNPGLDPAGVDDVVLGCATPTGDSGGVLGRSATLLAGWPASVPSMQLSRNCGTGLEAVNSAAARVRSGWDSLVVAGGVESLSRVRPGATGDPIMFDPAVMRALSIVPEGVAVDLLATRAGITRHEVDSFAVESQHRAAKAWANGFFAGSVVPIHDENGTPVLDRDEMVRADTSLEALGKLAPAFAEMARTSGYTDVLLQNFPEVEAIDHVHTAASSAGHVDGAALVLLGSKEAGERHGLTPRARLVVAATTGTDPVEMLAGAEPACRLALSRSGMDVADIDLLEINETFAAVPIQLTRALGFDPERVNPNGGAIAMGHPFGASGAMLVGTVLDELDRGDLATAMVSLAHAGGTGNATIFERV